MSYTETERRPDHRSNSHVLRHRRHDFVLPCRLDSLTDSNFIMRHLFKDSLIDVIFYFCNAFPVVAVCLTTVINEYE